MMSHTRLILSALLVSLFSLFACLSAQADETTTVVTPATSEATTVTTSPVVVERHVIVTTVPAAKEVFVMPSNYTNCFPVEGWFGNVWVPKHNICLYKDSSNGAVWIEGYWACSKYKIETGDCTNWDWMPARWVY